MKGKDLVQIHDQLTQKFLRAQKEYERVKTNYDVAKRELTAFRQENNLRLKVLESGTEAGWLKRLLGI